MRTLLKSTPARQAILRGLGYSPPASDAPAAGGSDALDQNTSAQVRDPVAPSVKLPQHQPKDARAMGGLEPSTGPVLLASVRRPGGAQLGAVPEAVEGAQSTEKAGALTAEQQWALSRQAELQARIRHPNLSPDVPIDALWDSVVPFQVGRSPTAEDIARTRQLLERLPTGVAVPPDTALFLNMIIAGTLQSASARMLRSAAPKARGDLLFVANVPGDAPSVSARTLQERANASSRIAISVHNLQPMIAFPDPASNTPGYNVEARARQVEEAWAEIWSGKRAPELVEQLVSLTAFASETVANARALSDIEVAAREEPRSMHNIRKDLGRKVRPADLRHPKEIEAYVESLPSAGRTKMFLRLDDLELAPGTFDFWENTLDRSALGLL